MPRAPIYEKIMQYLKDYIESEKLSEGDRIMSESELCSMFKVSRITAKRALDELENEGYINRCAGKGNFVASPKISHTFSGNMYSLTDEMRKRGKHISSKVVTFAEVAVSSLKDEEFVLRMKRKMYLSTTDKIFFIRTIRYEGQEIIALDNTTVPEKICPGLTLDDVERYGLDYLMKEKYHCSPTRATEYLFAKLINATQAEFLDVRVGTPALKIQRISYYKNTPVMHNYRIFKGEKCYYKFDLKE